MCAYRPRANDHGQRPYPPRPNDDFYEDRRSRSRSRSQSRSRSVGRRDGSAYRRSPPSYDAPRGPSQRYGRDSHRDNPAGSPDYNRRNRDRRDPQDRRRSRSPRRGRGTHYDRDRPSRSQSRSRSRSYDSYGERPPSRGRPSKEIMLEGLAPHLTENDISSELQEHYHVIELDDVRVIRDRATKQSRQFGFLRFPTLEDAEKFMDTNYPFIYLYGQHATSNKSEDAKVRIAFGKERKDARVEDTDWTCKICNVNNYSTRVRCFKCQTLRPDPASIQKAANVGDNDAAINNTPSQFLLFRGLEASTSEELFAKGVAKLNKPSGSQLQTSQALPKKGAKVASTTGDANLGAREGTLRRVLLVRDRSTNESWRYGFAEYATADDAQAALTRYNSFDRFTIASKLILVSYIHAGVFIPVFNALPSTLRFTFSPLANPSMRLAYWDEDGYVTELVISAPESAQGDTGGGNSAEGSASKSTKDADKPKKRKAQEPTSTSAKKPAPSHLQFWSNRHAELHGIKNKDNEVAMDTSPPSDTPLSRSYADLQRNCCYLCMRQFKSSAEVNKHERLSDLHRKNLKDEEKVQRANHKLEKHGVQHHMTDLSDGSTAVEYRDRAKERRRTHGVVNKKGEIVQQGSTKHKSAKTSKDSDDETSAPMQPSKGAALLSKMGYNPGQGLGASGEGVTAPIAQDIYVAGVGLGAEGGKVGDALKEAERNTKGDYSAFAERTKEGARERYRNLG